MNGPSEWTANASQDNATATATKTGVANRWHVLTNVSASFSAASTKLLQIKSGTTVIWEDYVANGVQITFPKGLRSAAVGDDVSAVLAASGTGGVLGKVNLSGYTE